MTGCFLTKRAREDIKHIGRYTFQKWGARQSNKYLMALEHRFRLLSDRPRSGLSRDDIGVGFRSALAGSHIIIYREVGGAVEIARVLHRRMDVPSRMKEGS